MTTLALEINDTGLRAVDESGERFDSPGLAYTDGEVVTGAAAQAQARLQPGRIFNHFWHDLSLESLPANVRGAESSADLAYHHLQQLTARAGQPDRVILAVPGHYTREQLSLLLGIARECALPVHGLVDLALAAADRPAPGRQLLHVELMLHQCVLTRLVQGRRLRRDQVSVVPEAGQLALRDVWARAVADTFVRTTRYDPMHSADAEQQLYDRLTDWVGAAHRDGKTVLAVERNEREHSTSIDHDALAAAAEPIFRRILRRISAASRPGEPLTLLLSDRLVAVPGLHSALRDAIPGVELVDLAPAAAARGALRRESEILSDSSAVAFVTSVSWDAGAGRIASPPCAPRPPGAPAPTHVVYGGRSWRIAETPLLFGAEPTDAERIVVVTGDTQGVSRRHCAIQRNNGGEVVVTDHSRYGTFINDRRVDGSAKVHYGDIVRLGTSAQLLQLVTEQTGNGA